MPALYHLPSQLPLPCPRPNPHLNSGPSTNTFVPALLAGAQTITAIRLRYSTPSAREGVVEALVGSQWTFITIPGYYEPPAKAFDANFARVACRQLGWGGGQVRNARLYTQSLPGPVALSEPWCEGSETTLNGCSFMLRDVAEVAGGNPGSGLHRCELYVMHAGAE